MNTAQRTKWLGGIIRYQTPGRPGRFYIRRMISGHHYRIALSVVTEKAALAELEKFEKDPAGYQESRNHPAPSANALRLEKDIVADFLKWSAEEKHNTAKWIGSQRRYLAWWAGKLFDRDLRRLTVREIQAALVGQPARQPRIAVLKVFYAWAREKDLIATAEDPTYGKLKVPQSSPEQVRRLKAISREDFTAVRDQLSGHWRDALTLLAGTGWHVSELVRFVHNGAVVNQLGRGEVLVCPFTKGGETLRTAVSKEVAQAGKRLLDRGTLEERLFYKMLHRANRAARKLAKAGGREAPARVTPGIFRHSVATWAIEQGADVQAVATFLGHRSPRTTKKFYATHATPTKVPTLT